jgi:hypothetical protein
MTALAPLSPFVAADLKALDPAKFRDPFTTAKGEARATVALTGLDTLWFNTGTLCNIACLNCYIESSPKNDALSYITAAEVEAYLDEIATLDLPTREIGFTGGEPFMNREIIAMVDTALDRGFEALVLTNAMRPMRRFDAELLDLRQRHGARLTLRISLDHPTAAVHDAERGEGAFDITLDGLIWLARNDFSLAVAGRHLPHEDEADARAAFRRLFDTHAIPVDARDRSRLVLFPEMDSRVDVPEITTACWSILGKSPNDVMCASSRMVVKRRGADRPAVLSCTLLPYEPQFELGATLADALAPVPLNHPHCAKFCVLGGASCSAR